MKRLQRLLNKVSVMKFLGKTILLGNYDKRTKPKQGGITVKSIKSSLQRERGGTLVL